jgi:hypothetical protein
MEDHTTNPILNRIHQTHRSEGISRALQKLPQNLKVRKNTDITERNTMRELARAEHVHDPEKFPDPPSDDKSLITVPNEAVLSPSSCILDLAEKLTPNSTKNLTHILLGNKCGTADLEAERPAKHIREEIIIQPGMSLPIVFHCYLGELYHNNNNNIPFSCFTSHNLEYINTSYSQLAMKKLNAEAPGEKQKSVMETAHFEENRLKESALNCGQWQEAAHNFCVFIKEISGDPDSKASKCWQAHFGFFDNTEDAEDNFPAILLADITLCTKYWVCPFTFERELYSRELDKAATTMCLAKLERRWLKRTAPHPRSLDTNRRRTDTSGSFQPAGPGRRFQLLQMQWRPRRRSLSEGRWQ